MNSLSEPINSVVHSKSIGAVFSDFKYYGMTIGVFATLRVTKRELNNDVVRSRSIGTVFSDFKCGFRVDPSPDTTIEATFTPDGQYLVSGTTSFPLSLIILEVLGMEICLCGESIC
ncbi:uncharacterized protein LOC111374422 isoform X2 [Olea europaea var. sylvestris]|uniref:uncharacterized protein LOC111374422 isoform X2 n=1 Tax=Olea europaea var. sylvestris TaxID=158386 RepID=UPI000C1D5088|nr:uncharacterized protein LOC111374422 isoform X2 [Olea europaea var. sylvestris]